jgi:multidrug efflux pump subunit AcrA (membrane-fusion protein)
MHSLMLAGTVVPRIETTLGFRVAGKGDLARSRCRRHCAAGPAHRAHRSDDYRLAVDNARAALVSAEADYARAKADFERYQMLRGSASFMTQTLETRQSVSSTTQARVDQAKSQLSSAENNLAYTELHADAAGVITAVQAEVGQVLAQGQGMVKLAPQRRARDSWSACPSTGSRRCATRARSPSNCGPTPASNTRPSCASCRPARSR